jgi:cytidylate kinase
MIIAIDGPAGSGKSTVAKLVAQRLGFACLDTGAMYRAVTVRALEQGLDPQSPEDAEAIAAIAASEPVTFEYADSASIASRVLIAGLDVTAPIRLPATDAAVSKVSALPGVRLALTEQQQRLGHAMDTVMEGRDIGTAVFPDADVKVFLTASPEARAQRRCKQNVVRGVRQGSVEETLAEIERRDADDSRRALAPLSMAPDATPIDTTDMGIEEVVGRVAAIVDARRAAASAAASAAAGTAASAAAGTAEGGARG